ncbi:T9SS type A sorting domain-containing protein, partial [Nonlabens sp.]|uniref:T9SS type A sorting domain-containing protein n=1 Tax=Nonlabens sp. TaxID=1888209 RepID=UPI003F699511
DQTSTNNPSLFNFSNDDNQSWTAVANTNSTSLIAGEAYRLFIRGNRSIDLTSNTSAPSDTKLVTTGTLITDDVVQPFSSTLATGDFVFTGNPYQSKVDISLLMNDATAREDVNPNFMYVWNPQAGARGAYRAFDFSNSTSSPSDSEVNGILQPGQSMFLLVDNDGDGNDPSVTFKESFKSAGSNLTATYSIPEATLSMDLSNGGSNLDGFKVNFSSQGNDGIDSFDLNKLNNLDENIALVHGAIDLAIENRSLPIDGTILPLKINRFSTGSYDFKFQLSGLNGVDAYLLDHQSGQYHFIQNNNQTIVTLSFDESDPSSIATDRFLIEFSNTTLSGNDFNLSSQVSVYPNPVSNGLVKISGLINTQPVSVQLYNLSGQLLVNKSYEVSNNEVVLSDLESLNMGVYLLTLQQEGQQVVKQLIIE